MADDRQTASLFDSWFVHMDEALAAFQDGVPPGLRVFLDYSVPSLDLLEAWLLDRYPDEAAIRADRELPYFDGAARYVGEVFRTTLGGTWRVRTERDGPVNLLPELIFADAGDPPMGPFALVTAALSRRTGSTFSKVFHGTARVVDPLRR